MKLTLDFARYIISLQGIAAMEIGFDEIDKNYLEEIEVAFPILKQEREEKEFKEWVWNKTWKHPKVEKLRYKIQQDISDSKYFAVRQGCIKEYDNLRKELNDLYLNKNREETYREYRIEKSLEKMKNK